MANSKKARLLEKAKQRAPRQAPERLTDIKPKKQGYRVVPLSFYTDEADFLGDTARVLKDAGFTKANRSMVAQVAVSRLMQELEGKSAEEILIYVLQQQKQKASTTPTPAIET